MTAAGRRVGTAAGLVLLASTLASTLGACSDGSSAATPSPSSSASSSSPTSASPSPITTTPLPSPTATVPATTRTTLPAAPVDEPAEFGTGVTVDVVSTRAVTVTGKGPGELSGPAVAVTLKVTNDTRASIDVTDSVVAASYGDGRPANESSSSPSRPLRGSVQAGDSVTATYVFLIPVEQRSKVHLSVSYDPTTPVVSLVGDLR